jgi:hypothetical protein
MVINPDEPRPHMPPGTNYRTLDIQDRDLTRLRGWWDAATPQQKRTGWYKQARALAREIAAAANCTEQTAAAIIAVCSCNTTWARNMSVARQAATTAQIGHIQHVRRCVADLKCGCEPDRVIGHMPKVYPFYLHIMTRPGEAAIDRWMVRAILGDWDRDASPAVVNYCQRCLSAQAKALHVSRRRLQEVIWVTIRAYYRPNAK